MNNYQLNNTSVYLGGQCKWDLILKKDGNGLSVDGFCLSPLSPVVPYYVDTDVQPLNYDHGFNLKTFYEQTKGTFWDDTYFINQQSDYDISRYAGCRRRDYNSYKKQFEYLQPVWLESLDENSVLSFDFVCYTIKDGVRTRQISKKTLVLDNDKFSEYFYNWLKKLRIKGPWADDEMEGDNKVMYVSFEDNQFAVSGVNVSSGEPSGVIDLSYMMDNFVMYERPLIETDNMITKTLNNYNLITSQLYNFNFCFNLGDIIDSNVFSQLQHKPVSVDCVVRVDGKPLRRTNIFSNYEKINKSQICNFVPVGGTYFDGDSLEENFEWTPNDQTQEALDNGDISNNVLDYLKDYEYPDFVDANKLTQDIIHWGYTEDTARTFNLYNGFRGLLQYPSIKNTDPEHYDSRTHDGSKYYYELCYDDGSNGVACDTNLDTYGDGCNGLAWVQPGRVLYVSNYDDANKVSYYSAEYAERYGVSINDIASYWSVSDIKEWAESLELSGNILNKKILVVYLKSLSIDSLDGIGNVVELSNDLRWISTSNYEVIVTTNLDTLMLQNWVRSGLDNPSTINNMMRLIDIIVYVGNMGVDVHFETEIFAGKNDVDEVEYYKSKNHTHFPHRHSGSLVPFVCPETYNKIYTIDEKTDTIIEKREYQLKTEDGLIEPFEYVWSGCGCVRELYPDLSCEFQAEYDESWYDGVKLYLKNLYGLDDENDINYVFGLYDCDMNFTHIDEDTIKYKIKMNLL